MECPSCGLKHPGFVSCAKAKYDLGALTKPTKPMANVIQMANDPRVLARVANSTTYLYRDPVKRRAYMRDLMRRRRAKQ